MSKKRDRLTTPQRKALAMLLDGAKPSQAAAAVNVSARTMSRWLHEDERFGHEVRQATRQTTYTASARNSANVHKAIDVIGAVIDDEAVRPADRLRAAMYSIDAHLRLIEVTDILERLEALEAQ